MSRERALGLFALGVALAGVLRGTSVHLWKERSLRGVPTTRIDPRYAQLAAVLPPTGRLGYVSDEPLDTGRGGRLYFDALYALAPRVLSPDAHGHRLVVANVFEPASIERLSRQHGLLPVAVFGGTALLEKR